MRKSLAHIIILSSIVFLLVPASALSSVILKKRFSEVVNGSELVIEGRVVSKETRLSPESGKPFTYFTIEIMDVVKGTYSDSYLEVGFMGGKWGEFNLAVTDMHMPGIGETGIYFVEDLSRQQVHPLYGWQQGHYLIIRNAHTGEKLAIPAAEMKDSVDGRALSIQQGIPLNEFKRNVRDAAGGGQ